MDWERTKTVLILAFLLLNSVFVYQLWLEPALNSSMSISPQQVEAKIQELNYRNISVDAQVPRRLESRQMLAVTVPALEAKEIAAALLGAEFQFVPLPPDSGYRKFKSSLGKVEVYEDGRIDLSHFASGGNIPREDALDVAECFLQESLGKPADAQLDRIVELDDGGWLIQYSQRWRRKLVDVSRIIMLVDDQGVRKMHYYWVDILGYSGEEDIVTIPATGALTLAADILPGGTSITDIRLSWYRTPVLAQQWNAYPVWVLETNVGVLYINAYTGELEGREDFPAGKTQSSVELNMYRLSMGWG